MKFSEMPYQRPDVDALLKAITDLTARFEAAGSAADQLERIKEYDRLTEDFSTMSAIASIRNSIDTRDPFYEAEQEFFDQIGPTVQEKAQLFTRAIVNSKFRPELEKELGSVVFVNAEMELKSFSPEIIPLLQEEATLCTRYQKLYASAKIPFDGKECTVAQLGAYKQSPDRAVREAATRAEGRFFDENRAEFDEIFDKLVKNRTEQAQKLGFDNFVPLGYLRRQRNCYGPAEVAGFRRQIVSDIVPLVSKIKERQRQRIGVDRMMLYDAGFAFPDGNPKPHGSPEELLAAAKKMYEEMSPETGEFIGKMFGMELFDVLAKEGKAPGGYCTDLESYKVPFVFSNFNGTSDDVDVLTHEMGHAFASYTAYRTIPYGLCRMPSMEGAETHSMSMEFLTSPWHHLFFGEDTAKYQLAHAEDALTFLPYGTMVDHFQQIVYENPGLTPEQRNEKWAGLEKIYRPYIDFGDLPFYGRGAGWQRQLHIYLYPFYYLDYCMAQTVALEFFTLHLKNPALAWKKYLEFVRMGGRDTFVGLVRAVGMKTPLDEGALAEIAGQIGVWLQEHQIETGTVNAK